MPTSYTNNAKVYEQAVMLLNAWLYSKMNMMSFSFIQISLFIHEHMI